MKKYIRWILPIAVVLGLIVIYILKKDNTKEVPLPEPPKTDIAVDSMYIDDLRKSFEEEKAVWEQQKKDMIESNKQKDADLARMKRNRRANNDHINDSDLKTSIDQSLRVLHKKGY